MLVIGKGLHRATCPEVFSRVFLCPQYNKLNIRLHGSQLRLKLKRERPGAQVFETIFEGVRGEHLSVFDRNGTKRFPVYGQRKPEREGLASSLPLETHPTPAQGTDDTVKRYFRDGSWQQVCSLFKCLNQTSALSPRC